MKQIAIILLMLCPMLTMAQKKKAGTNPAIAQVTAISTTIDKMSIDLWNFSELSLREFKSAEYLKNILTTNGFKITHDGPSGIPTCFIAEYGSGLPVIGILVEYDALPGLGNEAVPTKTPRLDANTNGHGCGHNLIGAGAMGSALAMKAMLESKQIAGTLRVYGAAAEETEGAKVYMARDGYFNDVDAMLHWHPYEQALIANGKSAAQSVMYIEFRGKTAHAGNAPWLGRSALDAAELFTHGVNMMREHVEPTARIQYIITNGGAAPNVVPDFASVTLVFRESSRAKVEKGVEWVKEIASGAALMTQTKTLAVDYFGLYDLLPNETMAQRMQTYLEVVGVPVYTESEKKFATDLQQSMSLEPRGLATKIVPLMHNVYAGGSTDVGDVSWITPTMGLAMPTMPIGVGLHTWGATASHGTTIGQKGAIGAAKVMAAMAFDLFTDKALLKAVKAEFALQTEGFVYKSPLNPMIQEPISLPNDLRKHGTVIQLKEEYIKNDELTPSN